MKKSSVPSQNLDTFPSPGAPDYRDTSVGGQKGWCSERVPSSGRRYISAAATSPFYSGRTLPSKWEDAERWICSPVANGGYGVAKNSILQQPQRRPKSKSGPLGPPAYYSNHSPAAVPALDGVRNFAVGSPFSTGVFGADGLSVCYSGSGDETKKNVARLSESYSLPSSQDECEDEKHGSNKDEERLVSCSVSRRDMATQMSPDPGESSLCNSPVQVFEDQPAKLEVRDVQVDKGATIVSWSRRHKARTSKTNLADAEAQSSSWAIEEASRDVSKLQRDEAKITAWENLQKAKAEASIRKLEMKLEKKRSSSMDKIMKELKIAETKAQKTRSSISTGKQDDKRTPRKVLWFRRHSQTMGCFTCHAFS